MNIKTKIKDEWRKLNLEISYHQKIIKQNSKAGQKFTEEYINWINEKIKHRDTLTNQF
jgi:hypothetical protein